MGKAYSTLPVADSGPRPARRRRATSHPAGRPLLLLFALGLVALVMHLGPVYPAAMAQLHLRLPQLMQLGAGPDSERSHTVASRVMLEASGSSIHLGVDGSTDTLSFDLCGGFASQRVALVSGERCSLPACLPAWPQSDGRARALNCLQYLYLSRTPNHLDLGPTPPQAWRWQRSSTARLCCRTCWRAVGSAACRLGAWQQSSSELLGLHGFEGCLLHVW